MFPIIVLILDLTVSTIAIFFIKTKPDIPGRTAGYGEVKYPFEVMKRGYFVSLFLESFGLFYICKNLINLSQAP